MATRATAPRKARATAKTQPERPPCLCGCGGFPKGPKSRFFPGHDARFHSAQKKAQAQT